MNSPNDGRQDESTTGLVAVFRTADPNLLAILKTVLEAAKIDYVVQGGEALGMLPLGPLATGISRNLMAATLLVSADRAAEARELMRPVSENSPE